MKKLLFVFSILIGLSIHSQNFTLQNDSIYLSGLYTNNDFDASTNLDAHVNGSISWEIITDSTPSNWDYSICFPSCHSIGVSNGILNISDGNSYFLNCHFYPNNTPGPGFITMKISDSITTKFVSWYGLATTASSLVELNQLNKPSLLKITDLLGRETEPVKGELSLHFYSDGSILKKMMVE